MSSQLEPRSEALPRFVARPDSWFARIKRRAFIQLGLRSSVFLDSLDGGESFLFRGRPVGGIADCLNDEYAISLQREHSGINRVHKTLFLAQFLIKN